MEWLGAIPQEKVLAFVFIVAVMIIIFGATWVKTYRRLKAQPQKGVFVETDHAVKALPEAGQEFMATVNKSRVVAKTIKNAIICLVCILGVIVFGGIALSSLFDLKAIKDGSILWYLIPALVCGYVVRGSARDVKLGLRLIRSSSKD